MQEEFFIAMSHSDAKLIHGKSLGVSPKITIIMKMICRNRYYRLNMEV